MASFLLQLKQLLFGTGVPSKNKKSSNDSESYAESDDTDTSDDSDDSDDD